MVKLPLLNKLWMKHINKYNNKKVKLGVGGEEIFNCDGNMHDTLCFFM